MLPNHLTDTEFVEASKACESQEVKITGFDREGFMIVHTPNSLKGTKNLPAFIELHGGGVIGGSP